MSDDDIVGAFDAVCTRLAGFGERVCTEWADGYLTALAAGPRAVPIDEWLEPMCGDAFRRAFADPDDVRQARDALLARCGVIARELDAERLLDDERALWLRPVLYDAEAPGDTDDPNDTEAPTDALPAGSRWAAGFLDAVGDFAADWRPPERASDDARAEHAAALSRIEALALDAAALKAHLAAMHRGRALDRDELVDEACFAVQDLRLWWLDYAPRPAPIRVEAKPGRNDPCPCGSGRKYKKCCGAAA